MTGTTLHQLCQQDDENKLIKFLNSNPDNVNELDESGYHCIFYAALANDNIFSALLNCTKLDLNIISPSGLNLWEFLIVHRQKNKSISLFKKHQQKHMLIWASTPYDLIIKNTPLAEWLVKEKIFLPEMALSKELLKTKSLLDIINLYYPKLNKSNLKEVLCIISLEPQLNLALLQFLKIAKQHLFNLDKLNFFLKNIKDFSLFLKLNELYPLLSNNKIKLERFFENVLNSILKERDEPETYAGYHVLVEDTLSAYNFLKSREIINQLPQNYKIKNLYKIHQLLTGIQRNVLKNERNFNLNLEDSFPEINSIKNTWIPTIEYRVVVPQNNLELCLWGSLMDNCIASYAQSCSKKKTLVLGLFNRNNELKINLEIYQGKLKQIFKKSNQTVSGDQKIAIEDFLIENKIIKERGMYIPMDLFEEFENLLNLTDPGDEVLRPRLNFLSDLSDSIEN